MAEYSIISCLRTDKPMKKNGKYPIYLRVRVRDKETKIPTNLEVSKEQWDNKRKEPKQAAIRTMLYKQKGDLEMQLSNAMADGQFITIDMVKDFCAGKKKVKAENQSFFEYFNEFIERKRKEVKADAIAKYQTTYKFLEECCGDFRICDMSLKLIERFDDFLIEEKGNAPGGRFTKHKNLRSVIIDIDKHDIPIKNPYKNFTIPQPSKKEIYLDKDQLKEFRELRSKFSHNSKEYKVLQMYLFSCYCGLRYSDVIDLKWSDVNFEKEVIVKEMIKTQHDVTTPLFRRARAVLLELSDSKKLVGSDKKVFHGYSSTTVNKTLKTLIGLTSIDKHITYHSSRHTFATLLATDGTDIHTISKYLGHKSLDVTQRYLKYNLKIAIESAKNIKTFD